MPRLRLLLPLLLLATPALGQDKDAGPAAAPACPASMDGRAATASSLTCTCPAGALTGGSVWGSGPYTADSAVCRAAVHAGAVGSTGGTVTVEMLPGAARYPGSTRNGVQTSDWGAYGAGYRFAGVPTAPTTRTEAAACPADMRAQAPDTVVRCVCPAGASGGGTIWGTGIYTSDSAVCEAAQHAGMVGRRGGPVTVRALPGLPGYTGTTRNGIRSSDYGAYQGSYRFEGKPAPADPAG